MTKEEIDRIVQILEMLQRASDQQQVFELIEKWCKICSSQNLWDEMQKKLKEAMQGNEEVFDDYVNLMQQLLDNMHSQIPDNLKDYFYFEVIDRGVDEDVLNYEQSKEAAEIYNKKIDELTSLPEEERIQAIKKIHNGKAKIRIIKTLGDNPEYDYIKINVLDELQEEASKVTVACTIVDDNIKISALDKLQEEASKAAVVCTIVDDDKKLDELKRFDGQLWFEIARTLSVETKIEFSKKFDVNTRFKLLGTIANEEAVLEELNKLDLDGEKNEVLKRLYKKNNEVLSNIDLRILDKKYLETIGEDKINQISCYPEIQKAILGLSEKEYNIFARCLNTYLSDFETDEWTTIAYDLLFNFQNRQYTKLIENLKDVDEIDIKKLTKILQLKNYFHIKTVEDFENYEEIKRVHCDEIINGIGSVEEKKKAVLFKLFCIDMPYARKILDKYKEDIDSIEDGVEKDFVLAIQEIINVVDEDVLKQIYDECEEIGIINKNVMERKIKNAYGKKYNEGLYETKCEDRIEEKDLPKELRGLNLNVYDAGTDFKMLITSLACVVHNNIEDYMKDWNRPAIASQHFCASYIRNDMIKTERIPHLCYGFIQMKEDALMLACDGDMASGEFDFIPSSVIGDRYYSPENQINKTTGHNEMDYRRIQGGEKKQPDYIVAFKKGGEIENIDKIAKAAQDWEGKLPVVIIDVDRCLESERAKILGDEQNERTIRIF